MLLPRAAYHLRRALRLMCVLGGCVALGVGCGFGWRAGVGVLGGTAAMAGALGVSAMRCAAMFAQGDRRRLGWLSMAVRLGWIVATLALLLVLALVLKSPGWSLGAGATVGVIALVLGFVTGKHQGDMEES